MIANIRLESKEVEVAHWEGFMSQQDFGAKTETQDKLPVPSSEIKKRIGHLYPGLEPEWTRLESGRYRPV